MTTGVTKKFLAGVLTSAIIVSGSGFYSMANGKNASAADDTALTKVLEAEDIDLRSKWDDTSNIGTEHEVTLSTGTKIKVKDNGSMRKELSSQYLADNEMGTGANLGNTMEAVYMVDYKKNASVSSFETIWGQPITTRKYIDSLHSYGINTLRIPVAWSNGDADDGTYKIRGDLLDRVEEIANYALDNGMYVIINDHWDNQWWGQFGACLKDDKGEKYADTETRQAAWDRYESYWTQICERFQGYSDHLIFEGANEELGDRLNDAICVNGPSKGYCKPDNAGKDIIAVSGNLSVEEQYETTNKINQKFVDIVRSTGGNNAYRHLLIPGFNTNIQDTADSRFEMPTDTKENGKNKLFLSVHYYTPWDFCGDGGTGDYTTEDQKATVTYFQDLKRFSDAGYAIIIGELGVCNPAGVSSSVSQWFLDTFIEATKYHAVPVLWETGNYFDRVKGQLSYKDIAIFYNTVNDAQGSTESDRISGGVPDTSVKEVNIPDYLDNELWRTPGIHAYVSYQTTSWDYRNAYKPIRNLGKDEHSWEYIKAGGNEVSAANTTVTDVMFTKDGEYTVSIDGIDLSSANFFNMLAVSTDIEVSRYPNITVTNAMAKLDGKDATDAPFDLVLKSDEKYYDLMLINRWDSKTEYPLGTLNADEKLTIPSKSIEITFTITGLEQVLSDIENGTYVDPESGQPMTPDGDRFHPTTPAPGEDSPAPGNDTPTPGNPTSSPNASSQPPTATIPATGSVTQTPPSTTTNGLKKGDTLSSGNYKYKVTKASAGSKKGTVTLTGLTAKGKSAKKLSVATTVKDKNGASYTVKALGKKAFSGAKATSITLNKQMKTIPDSAFSNCKKLNTLTLKAKLSKVSKNAFKGCKKKIKVKGTAKSANKKKLMKTSYKKFK